MTNPAITSPRPDLSLVKPRRGEKALAGLREFLENDGMTAPNGPKEFADFERRLHAKVMAVECEVVEEVLKDADVDLPAICINGRVYRNAGSAPGDYFTVAGKATVMRTVYRDRTRQDERAVSAMELKTGIIGGLWTPLAAQQAAWIVAQLTPGKAEELLKRVGNMAPSKSSLDRLPKVVSERWEENRETFEAILQETELIPEGTATVAVSLDGVMVPAEGTEKTKKRRETASQGRLTRGPAGYREVGCGTLSFYDGEANLLKAIRLGRAPEQHKATLKKSLEAELRSALRKRPDLRVVKIADGAKDNWTFLETLADGPEILDFFHAAEHLHEGLDAAYGEGTTESRAKFASLRTILIDDPDGATKVIGSLSYLHKKHPRREKLTGALNYFRKNRKRMQYRTWLDQGLPVGSGVVEATCKTLASQRLKLSGMQWGDRGAQAILTLRAWDQSDRFDRAWALVAATWHREITTFQPAPPSLRVV